MIKSFEIENMYGIRKLDVDFRMKNIYSNIDLHDHQIIEVDNEMYSMIPSFITKNASFKTSMAKSINLFSKYISKESIIMRLQKVLPRILNLMRFREDFEKSDDATMATEEEQMNYLSKREEEFISVLSERMSGAFNNVHFVGTEDFSMLLRLKGNREYQMIGTSKDLIIKNTINNEVFSMFNTILEIARKAKFSYTIRQNEWADIIINHIDNINFSFLDYSNFSFESIFVEDHDVLTNRKREGEVVRDHIKNIIEKAGFPFLKALLIRTDDNLLEISFDVKNKSFELFLKDWPTPISSKNLSFGTKRLLQIISYSLDIFETGGFLLIDEIETGMHLSLVKFVIDLFTNEDINKTKAQLIITSHNPNIVEVAGVNIKNVLLEDGKNFFYIKEFRKKEVNKTTDEESFVKSKNYYNDAFWAKRNESLRSTLSTGDIEKIMDKIEDYKYELISKKQSKHFSSLDTYNEKI